MQAARAVTRVLGGVRLREALAEVDDGTALRGRALVQELAYGTLRHWGTLDAIAGVLVRKPIADPLLRSLVAVALYQLDHTRAPAFAVVDRAVFAAGALVRPGAKALVNALLRRYLRERTTIGETVRTDDVARWSYPRWWIERVRRDHPECWESVLEAGNARPPLTLRVNLCVTVLGGWHRRASGGCCGRDRR
jgi:16S rRNA (cytosine967-C5)-methyltransferase